MIDVFISYAKEDRPIADELFTFLQENGFRPWMDKKNLIPGIKWQKAIVDALDQCDVCIFLISSVSATKRGFFQREMKLALNKALDLLDDDVSIIPVRIEECAAPQVLSEYQWMDYFSDREWASLLPSLTLAANQRGLVSGLAMGETPFVAEYVETKERDPEGRFEFLASVPKIVFPARDALGTQINNLLEGNISRSLLDFRKHAPENFRPEYSQHPSELQVHVAPKLLDSHFISLTSGTYWYGSGAAHGNSGVNSINIDVNTGTLFTADEIFQDTREIEQHIFQEVKLIDDSQLGSDEDLKDCIAGNLREKTFFDRSNMVCHFDQYEVFCYASGPFDIEVDTGLIFSGRFGPLSEMGSRLISTNH